MLEYASSKIIVMTATGLAFLCWGIIYIFLKRIQLGFLGLQWIFFGALTPRVSLWFKLGWMIPGILLLAADVADMLPKKGRRGRLGARAKSPGEDQDQSQV